VANVFAIHSSIKRSRIGSGTAPSKNVAAMLAAWIERLVFTGISFEFYLLEE
jgi:hypothetical protein